MMTATDNPPNSKAIRVMVVDDSAVIRGLFTRTLESNPEIEVVASVPNGELAVRKLDTITVDVIVLDIEMPIMDGITALPLLLQKDPLVKVIIASTLSTKNAVVTFQALEKGAAECLSKPSTTRELSSAEDFRRDLLAKTLSLGKAVQQVRNPSVKSAPVKKTEPLKTPANHHETAPINEAERVSAYHANKPIYVDINEHDFSLKKETRVRKPSVLAIGSSTGGPQALFKVLKHLKGVKQPIFITQHMPETFTTILAQHIERETGLVCKEGVENEIIIAGRAYLAPGGYHMCVERDGVDVRIKLNKDAPENYCRPAVDPMLRSLHKVYGTEILTTILTGMGYDGQKASKTLSDAGAMVLAQDEETSVVWGMPGAVAKLGICFDVLPIDKIGERVRRIADMH